MRLRSARPDEARALQEFVQAAFEGYRSFAPPGWEPPDELAPAQVERIRGMLDNVECWSCVAEDGDVLIGYTLWEPVDGLAHVRAVFVAEPHWGTGLATRLLRDGTAEMGRRGWTTGRLFTPAGQGRARRFYEREGWHVHQDRHFEPKLGLDMVQYRRSLR